MKPQNPWKLLTLRVGNPIEFEIFECRLQDLAKAWK